MFGMTKQYWRDRQAENKAREAKLASTAKILREAELQKDSAGKLEQSISERKKK